MRSLLWGCVFSAKLAVAPADGISPIGRSKDGLYDPVLADSEREAVADLLGYLENVSALNRLQYRVDLAYIHRQRAETDFFSGDPLRALSTLVYSDNLDLQRSAALTFAEITERGSSSNTKTST